MAVPQTSDRRSVTSILDWSSLVEAERQERLVMVGMAVG